MQKDRILWHKDGAPVSALYDDPYFSVLDGLEETRHVFLAGNGLPARLRDGFHIAELGFGTGLNALATSAAWPGPGRIRFTSFEAHPMDPDAMARALSAWPELADLAAILLPRWRAGARSITLPGMDLEVIEGDATASLPAWDCRADAWFLDGFSPAKNPALWTPEILAEVARHTAPGGTAATYTAAGHVRRALEAAGFTVTRQPGYGRKRHMTTARL